MTAGTFSRLSEYSVLLVSGRDARGFLQGQLSNDIDRVDETGWQWSAYHLPDGRVFALLLLFSSGQDIVAFLPASASDSVVQRLNQYRLRARVAVEVLRRAAFGVEGNIAGQQNDSLVARITNDMSIVVAPDADLPQVVAGLDEIDSTRWKLNLMGAGIPSVGSEIQGRYIGQMLNLDLLGAISFTKGCFSGQEVLARIQNLGRIKRRSFRFRCATRCGIGDHLTADGHDVGEVVDTACGDGGCEFLAVVRLDQIEQEMMIDGAPAERLTLPYESS